MGNRQNRNRLDGSSAAGRVEMWMYRFRQRWRQDSPIVTTVITIICVAAWLVQIVAYWLVPQESTAFISYNLAFNPMLAVNKPWMFITSTFLHVNNPAHIICNMITLWVIGPVLEKAMGHWEFLAFYLISGVGGGAGLMIYAAFVPEGWITTAVGASGALFGLFAALLLIYRQVGMDIQSLVIWMVINFLVPFFSPGIAWQSHIGGFVFGGLMIIFILHQPRWLATKSMAARTCAAALLDCLLLLVAVFLAYRTGVNALAGMII
ncbi:rhomboid family intramembrane serine protease [Bifidobacterium favimelis]|uniref:Rhomboid family intramembrane serine protease n=1 Tax=Bifidobacterium favimelis TaxID=3122979 RepID=A0ABU8ZPX7_9BIFI